MQRLSALNALRLKPDANAFEDCLTVIPRVRCRRSRGATRLDYESRRCFRVESSQQRENLGIDRHVSDRVLGLDVEILSRLDPNNTAMKVDRRPGQKIDLELP